MADAPDPSHLPDLSDLEAISRWRRSFDAGGDPGPPPVALPGLRRLERARRIARHLAESLGLEDPPAPAGLQFPLAAVLASRPAAPAHALEGAALAPPGLSTGLGPVIGVLHRSTPVLAFRAWGIARGRLRGARVAWPVATIEARCLDWSGPQAADRIDLPHTDGRCGLFPCGIHAFKAASAAVAGAPADGPGAVGGVALSGKVVEHEHGYRAAAATAVGVLVVSRGEAMRFDGIEVDELFTMPEPAVAAARLRARRLPEPGPERMAVVAGMLEAIKAPLAGGPAGE